MRVELVFNTSSLTGETILQAREGRGLPVATHVNTTSPPAMTVWLMGGEVMDAGAVMTVRLKLSVASSRGTDATHM